jgi:hypothetical protein
MQSMTHARLEISNGSAFCVWENNPDKIKTIVRNATQPKSQFSELTITSECVLLEQIKQCPQEHISDTILTEL